MFFYSNEQTSYFKREHASGKNSKNGKIMYESVVRVILINEAFIETKNPCLIFFALI